jgi:hypothetical protein
MRVPRTMLEDMPPETLDRMEQSVARREADEEAWGDLADSIARKLTAAGSGNMTRTASAADSISPCGRTA